MQQKFFQNNKSKIGKKSDLKKILRENQRNCFPESNDSSANRLLVHIEVDEMNCSCWCYC